MYQLAKNELTDTIILTSEERLDYFVSKVVESQEVWTLAIENSLMVLGTESHESFVVMFPHPEFVGSWFEASGLEEAELVGMELDGWLDSSFKELAEANMLIAVFPTATDEAVYLEPLDLQNKIKLALEVDKQG